MTARFHKSHSGFTLIEMVMTIVLIGIIAAVLAPVLSTTVEGFHNSQVRNDLTSQTRIVMERLSREIREASPDPADVTIGGPGNSSITFRQLGGMAGLVDMGTSMVKTYNGCRYVQVSAAGNVLNWDDDTGDAIGAFALATNLGSISFNYSAGTMVNSGVISIDLVMTDGNESISTYREIHIRNTQGACI